MTVENGNVSYIVEEDICNTYNQHRACFENMKKILQINKRKQKQQNNGQETWSGIFYKREYPNDQWIEKVSTSLIIQGIPTEIHIYHNS